MKLTSQAFREIEDWKLAQKDAYVVAVNEYHAQYERRPPADTAPNRNMLKALRLLPRLNTPQEWARLHVTEAYLRFNKSERR